MIRRRFLNLVEEDFDGRVYSLRRLDVAKHLFYPSTADAEAANTKNNGGGKTKRPSRMGTLQQLPPASTRFQRFPAAKDEPWHIHDDMFVLLSPTTSEGRILYGSIGGHCLIHDVDEGVNSTVPSLEPRMGNKQWSTPIAFSVPGAGGPGKEHESLYVMRSHMASPPYNPFCCAPANKQDTSRDFVVLDFNFNEPHRKWQHLPPPPCIDEPGSSARVRAFAVADGGRTIWLSSENESGSGRTHGTYCFDTVSLEWRHAGDWLLPFTGRAEHVPELNTWLGFCPEQPNHLCTVDLSGAMTMGTASQAPPTLQHVWEDFNPPPTEEWSTVLNPRFQDYVLRRAKSWKVQYENLVNLGAGRFCTAKFIRVEGGEYVNFHPNYTLDEEVFLVFTGVEVVRGGDGELRMVRHKSKRYSFTNNDNDPYIDWIL